MQPFKHWNNIKLKSKENVVGISPNISGNCIKTNVSTHIQNILRPIPSYLFLQFVLTNDKQILLIESVSVYNVSSRQDE